MDIDYKRLYLEQLDKNHKLHQAMIHDLEKYTDYQEMKRENEYYKRMIKRLTIAEKENAQLSSELQKLQNLLKEQGIVHNSRGAGRKKNDDNYQEQIKSFIRGVRMKECPRDTMKRMNISESTYYRYKREAKKWGY